MTHRADALSGHRRIVALAKALALLGSAAVVVATGMGWITYHAASTGITTSEALAAEPVRTAPDQNILIMGLDGRRDQRGRPCRQTSMTRCTQVVKIPAKATPTRSSCCTCPPGTRRPRRSRFPRRLRRSGRVPDLRLPRQDQRGLPVRLPRGHERRVRRRRTFRGKRTEGA